MREILQGVIDLHIHTGPSVAVREVDAVEMLKEAVAAGYRAFVVKDHYFPTMMSAAIVEKHLGNGKIKVFGGIALNNSVGGINVKAVDAAAGMGAKLVYMPTVSAQQHITEHQGKHFPGSGAMEIEEKPITYVDEKGILMEEVKHLLKYLASKPGLILSTGHGSAREVDVLIREAVKSGVKKILINHPFLTVNASIEQIATWAKLGAYIELNAGVFPRFVSWDILHKVLENVVPEQLVVDSDMGQKGGGSPVDGLYKFIQALMKDLNVSEKQINIMAKENPAKLLGM